MNFFRYYYVCDFGNYLRHFTNRRIIIYIISIWLFSFLIHLPNRVGWGEIRYSYMGRFCTLDTDLMSYTYFFTSVSTVAITVTFVYYLKIYLVVRRSKACLSIILGKNEVHCRYCLGINNNFDSQTEGDFHPTCIPVSVDEVKIVRTSFKIFFTFLLTWLPLYIIFFIHFHLDVPPYVYLYSGMIAHCNSTINFFVYFLDNSLFHKELKRLLCISRINKL